MVSKQQQLEWLVKNVSEFPDGMDKVFASVYCVGIFVGFLAEEKHEITRQEWQQERSKMSGKPEVDSSWYERGELPPIGCECLIHHVCWYKDIYREVKIVATTEDYLIVKEYGREQHYHLNQITFKPSKTEREKAIDELAENIRDEFKFEGYDLHTMITRSLSEFIYDAGYRKMKP